MKIKELFKLLMCLTICLSVVLLVACRGVTVKSDDNGGITITPNENQSNNSGNQQEPEEKPNAEVHHHTYTLDSSSTSYTCTEGGIRTWRCACGESFNETIEAPGHTIRSFEGKEATCEADGYAPYEKCINGSCDYTTYAVIPALGHDLLKYEDVQPTCTKAGVSDKVECMREGCSYSKETKVDALGHFKQIVDGRAATCTQSGYYAYEICTRSDCTGEGLVSKVTIDALGHDNINYEGKDATCTEFGWADYSVCQRCGHSTYSQINANGHSYDNGYCTVCEHTNPGIHTHLWDDGSILDEPTCTAPGTMKYTCTDAHCGDTKTEVISALGHDNKSYPAKAATCTEEGWYAYKECQRCDYSTKIDTPILGHQYSGGVTTTHPTCTHTGIKTYTCVECGKSYTEEIAAIGHDYVLLEVIDATCTENGKETWVCRNDRTHEDYKVIIKLGHDYGDWTIQKNANCGEAGSEIKVCNNDSSHIEMRPIDPTGNHDIDNSTGICNVCKQKVKDQLPTPTISVVEEPVIYWGLVDGAEAYEVTILQKDSKNTVVVVGTSIDLEPFYKNSNTLQIYIKALAPENSNYANSIALEYVHTIPYGSIVNYSGLGYGYNLLNGTYTDEDNKSSLSIFNEVMFNRLNADQKVDIYKHNTQAFLSESIQTYSDFLSMSLGTKFNINGSVGVNKIAKVSAGYSFETNSKYEKKNYNETQAVFYDMYYEFRGYQTGFGGYLSTLFTLDDAAKNAELELLLSDTFIEHVQMLEAGLLSPEQFINIYGSHIITEAVYGAKFSAHYEMLTDKGTVEKAFGTNIKQGISAGIEATIKGVDVGLNSSSEATFDTSFLVTDETQTTKTKFSFDAIGGKNPANFTALSFADFGEVAKNWTDTMNSEEDFVIIDVPNESLYYVWDFLPDEYSKAKELLMNYFFTQCDENYKALNEKVNEMYNDFYYFDIETGTLVFNISALQHANVNTNTTLDGVLYDDNGVILFDGTNHIVNIYPMYNGHAVKKVLFKGGYQTETLQGQTITGKFESISIKFDNDWTEDIVVEFENFAYQAPDGHAAIDFSAVSSKNITIISKGFNEIIGGNGIYDIDKDKGFTTENFGGSVGINADNGNSNLIFNGSGVLTVRGGRGINGGYTVSIKETASNGSVNTTIYTENNGGNGGAGIVADNVSINMSGELCVYGGDGGTGAVGSPDNVNGEHGGDGAKGGNGAVAIKAEEVSIIKGYVTATGGNGGNGGRGGHGNNKKWAITGSKDGGDGGKGGNGAYAIEALVVTVDNSSLILVGGSGGDGGHGGNCGKSGSNGDVGSGGSGGSGAAYSNAEITHNNSYVEFTDGVNGSKGANGT